MFLNNSVTVTLRHLKQSVTGINQHVSIHTAKAYICLNNSPSSTLMLGFPEALCSQALPHHYYEV